MYSPPAPKAPTRKPCGKCDGCNREFGYQPCKFRSMNDIDEKVIVRVFSKRNLSDKSQEQKLEESTIRYGMKRNFQLGVLTGAAATVIGYYLGQFLF